MMQRVMRSQAAIEANEVALDSHGVQVLVRVDTAEELERVVPLLPPGWRPCPPGKVGKIFTIRADPNGAFLLLRDDKQLTNAGLQFEHALLLLEAQVRAHIALHAPDHIFVHAGVVARGNRALVLPGMSFSGKTTLVAALVREGAVYYSDEFAPLDANGLVHPYARPLSVRDGQWTRSPQPVAALGGVAGKTPISIGAVVMTSYAPDGRWEPRPLTPGETVIALLSNTVAAQTRPQQAMRHLTQAAGGAAGFRSPRNDAAELAPQLVALLERLQA